MKLRMLYFAQLRERFAVDCEIIEVPASLDVSGLLSYLRGRGGVWKDALAESQKVCVAVDQKMVPASYPLSPGVEVALFQPVTGG